MVTSGWLFIHWALRNAVLPRERKLFDDVLLMRRSSHSSGVTSKKGQ